MKSLGVTIDSYSLNTRLTANKISQGLRNQQLLETLDFGWAEQH